MREPDDKRPDDTTLDEQRRTLTAQIAEIDAALPGTLVTRSTRCGKPTCRCKADPPQLHGPYHQWTRKIDGRTRTRLLTPEQAARYQPWFDNARRMRQLLAELENVSLNAAREAEDWPEWDPGKSARKTTGLGAGSP